MSLRTRISGTIMSLSRTGKVILYSLIGVFLVSALSLAWQINARFLVEVPRSGGTLTEGVVGLPRLINPLLAVTDGDKDLSALVYSGLMRHAPDGSLIPDLAESYSISDDGKTYSFILKPQVSFHDNVRVTTDDIKFTVEKAQDASLKSPKRAHWEGVSVEKISDREIHFILPQAYAPFLENTTLGILPKHIWEDLTAEAFALSEFNAKPIGSGPYKIKSIKRDGEGIPESYELVANKKFSLGAPRIDRIVMKFFTNEKDAIDAYLSNSVDAINSIAPESASELEKKDRTILHSPLPRTFALFFNSTDNPVLADLAVRQALDKSVDKDIIVRTVLAGFGETLAGPVPQNLLGKSLPQESSASTSEKIPEATRILEKAEWLVGSDGIREKKNQKETVRLAFSISTSDAPELKAVAEILKNRWRDIGAEVTVKIFEGSNLAQEVIRPRQYDALLFGQIINRDLDLYAFWHSSQRTDPGLNIALYTNPKADKMLEEIRTISDRHQRIVEFSAVEAELQDDVPAVFLYAPDFIYAAPHHVHGINLGMISSPSDRFQDIYTWYIDTDKIWKIFASP